MVRLARQASDGQRRGIVVRYADGRPFGMLALPVTGHHIIENDFVNNPDNLRGIRASDEVAGQSPVRHSG